MVASNMVYTEDALFFAVWNWNVPMQSAPQKSRRCGVSNELPWKTTFHTCCHNSMPEGLNMSSVIPLEEDSEYEFVTLATH